METKEMKYEEILQGLKCCVMSGKCSECPYDGDESDDDKCCVRMTKDAIALIEGQRDEIERLKKEGGEKV